jgi:hypothetical protein
MTAIEPATPQTLTLPTGPLGHFQRWWRNWRARGAARQELAGCGHDEVAHIARDVTLSPSELHTLAGRWPDSANLLGRRVAVLGLEQLTTLEPEVARDLQRVCGQCDSESWCERNLNSGERDRAWREYCSNATTFDALRSQQRDRRLMRGGRQWRSF